MRIAITGTHGAGKTTLVEALSVTLNLPLVPEQARVVAAEMSLSDCDRLLNDQELAKAFQWRILDRQVAEQKKRPDGFVADRCTLDALAYWEYYLGDHPDTARYRFRARLHAWRGLDLIVYVPPAENPAQDGFRLRDGHHEVDALIRKELNAVRSVGRAAVVAVRGAASIEQVTRILDFVQVS